jgi:hypothetical protein
MSPDRTGTAPNNPFHWTASSRCSPAAGERGRWAILTQSKFSDRYAWNPKFPHASSTTPGTRG